MGKLIEKLKHRWGVESVWQVLLILFIFSITGMTTLYVKKILYDFIGFSAHTPMWEKALVWPFIILPIYQLLFLGYGFLFGQFDFVWRFEKKSLERIRSLFSPSEKESV